MFFLKKCTADKKNPGLQAKTTVDPVLAQNL
jgi:hypothetical protein